MEEEEGEGVAVPEAVKVEVVQRLVEATTVEEEEVVALEAVEVEVAL